MSGAQTQGVTITDADKQQAAEGWVADLEVRLAKFDKVDQVVVLCGDQRHIATMSRLEAAYEPLFFRAYHAIQVRYYGLMAKSWGPPYDRPDGCSPSMLYHHRDPSRPPDDA